MGEVPEFKHQLVTALYNLLQEFFEAKGGSNPMMAALMFGIRGELPSILRSLDENPEAVEMIKEKLERVVGVERPIVEAVAEDEVIEVQASPAAFTPGWSGVGEEQSDGDNQEY